MPGKEQVTNIREVQQILRALSLFDETIPRTIPNGEYTKDLRKAIEIYQYKNQLPVTGEADEMTIEKMRSEYLFYQSHDELLGVTPFHDYKISFAENDTRYGVYIIQAAINTIADYFNNIRSIDMTGYFDYSTVDRIKKFQKISGLAETGRMNHATWNAIARLYNIYINESQLPEPQTRNINVG